MHNSGRRRWRMRQSLVFPITLLLVFGTVSGVGVDAAWAADYPTWSEVQNARQSEAAAKVLVDQIRVQVEALKAETARTAEIAAQKGAEYEEADYKFQEAAAKANELLHKAEAGQAAADESRVQAGRVAALLARTGGGDITSYLLADAADAADLLSRLGYASRIGKAAAGLYDRAIQERNAAQSLTDQADRARDKLAELRLAAEQALAAAQEAADAADAAMAAQVTHQAELEAQLSVLTEKRAATERDFKAGEAARAAEAAARAAAAAAAAGPPGKVEANGWARPTSGHITSPFGGRIHPIYGTYRLHTGTDIANGCNVPIYAAHAGQVVYSGLFGTYGNWILIDHGSGIETGYAHIVNGGRLVAAGDTVAAGQMIARTGMTGAADGCHLHFEVRINGTAVDAEPFMRDRGITLG